MTYIQFQDPGFETAVRETLGSNKKYLTDEDLLNIKGVLVSEKQSQGFSIPWISGSSSFSMIFPSVKFRVNMSENGKWLDDLKKFTHVETLHLYVPTNNLSLLKQFEQLKELYIVSSQHKDWSFLTRMLHLKNLCLKHCLFSDLSILSDLCLQQQEIFHQERERYLQGVRSNLHIPRLTNLQLEYCGISDISPFADCKWVSELDLSHNQITDLTPLAKMRILYYATLRYNSISDVTPLEALTQLYYLNLRHNQISDVSMLADLARKGNLSRLYLGYNPISDFSAMKDIDFSFKDFG